MTYQIIITEEVAANVSVTTDSYPITIEYNATNIVANAVYGNAEVAAYLAANAVIPITTQGNVTAPFFFGNGSQLTGIATSYGNANVAANLAAFGSNPISTTGNVTAGFFVGNGSLLTGMASSYGNANVAANLAAFANNPISTTGNVTAGNILGGANVNATTHTGTTVSVTANVTGGNLTTAGQVSATGNITAGNILGGANVNATTHTGTTVSVTGNVTGGNITTTGQVSATGNITAGNILGGANVNATTHTGTTVSVTGNVSGGNIVTGGQIQATGNISGGNITGVANVTSTLYTGTAMTLTGNVQAAAFQGSGSGLTGIPAGNISGTVATANTVTNATQSNITAVGTLTSLNVSGAAVIAGNLTVTGNTTFVNVDTITTQDPIPSVGRGANNTPLASDDGKDRGAQLWYYSGSEQSAFSGYDNSAGKMILATQVTIANEVVTVVNAGNTVIGNLESTSAVVTGTVTGGNIVTAGSVSATGNVQAGNIVTAGQVFVSDITGAPGQNVSITADGTGDIHLDSDSVRIGDNNTDATIVTHGTGDLILRTHEGAANQGSIRIYDGVNGNIDIMPNGLGLLNSTDISATGTVNAANLITAGLAQGATVSATGNVIGGNINSLAEISSAGNVTVSNGNILLLGTTFGTAQITNTGNISANGTYTSGRIVIGNGWAGDISTNFDYGTDFRGARLAMFDRYTLTANATPSRRHNFVSAPSYDLGGGTITGTTQRFSGMLVQPILGNVTVTSTNSLNIAGARYNMALGPIGNAAVGNANVQVSSGILSGHNISAGTYAGNLIGIQLNGATNQAASANVGTMIAVGATNAWTGVIPTNNFVIYNPGSSATVAGLSQSANSRAATNYYFLRNDDAAAQNKLGSLREYHEFKYEPATSGTVDINKANGQIQSITPTGNITIGSYTNFVASASDGTNTDQQIDTVTLIIAQGATPYAVTMPTGNAAIKYASNVTTVGSTANSVTMISITATTISGSTVYLTAITPEFV